MGALLARMGKEVTVLFDYDSSVRGSMSDAFLIFDDVPIANPVVEEADIMLKLADKGHLRIHGRTVITDLGLGLPGQEQIPFASLGSQHFGKELFGNMIALGRLLRLAGIDFDEASIRESLPRRFVDENVAAIRVRLRADPGDDRGLRGRGAALSVRDEGRRHSAARAPRGGERRDGEHRGRRRERIALAQTWWGASA